MSINNFVQSVKKIVMDIRTYPKTMNKYNLDNVIINSSLIITSNINKIDQYNYQNQISSGPQFWHSLANTITLKGNNSLDNIKGWQNNISNLYVDLAGRWDYTRPTNSLPIMGASINTLLFPTNSTSNIGNIRIETKNSTLYINVKFLTYGRSDNTTIKLSNGIIYIIDFTTNSMTDQSGNKYTKVANVLPYDSTYGITQTKNIQYNDIKYDNLLNPVLTKNTLTVLDLFDTNTLSKTCALTCKETIGCKSMILNNNPDTNNDPNGLYCMLYSDTSNNKLIKQLDLIDHDANKLLATNFCKNTENCIGVTYDKVNYFAWLEKDFNSSSIKMDNYDSIILNPRPISNNSVPDELQVSIITPTPIIL